MARQTEGKEEGTYWDCIQVVCRTRFGSSHILWQVKIVNGEIHVSGDFIPPHATIIESEKIMQGMRGRRLGFINMVIVDVEIGIVLSLKGKINMSNESEHKNLVPYARISWRIIYSSHV